MSGRCLEGIGIVSGFRKVAGRSLESVWRLLGGSKEGVWNVLGWWLECVRKTSRGLMDGTWKLHGIRTFT